MEYLFITILVIALLSLYIFFRLGEISKKLNNINNVGGGGIEEVEKNARQEGLVEDIISKLNEIDYKLMLIEANTRKEKTPSDES